MVEFDNHFSELHDGGYGEVNGIRGKMVFHCWFTSDIKPLNNQTIAIYSKGLETIALLKEGKKVIKQATAKCNPSDTFDFNIGAKLAFNRLMGEEVREVKRPAKVGEWIKIVNASKDITNDYKNGDILLVVKSEFYPFLGCAYYKNEQYKYANQDEYVVLENYQPEATKALSDYTDKEIINELSKRLEDKQ